MVLEQIKGTKLDNKEEVNFNEKFDELELRKKERDFSIIGNKFRLKVLTELFRKDKLNFNKLAELIKIDKSKLAYHIALLKNGNFINNEKLVNKEGKAFSFYSITDKGRQYLDLISKSTK
jgi:DNA-binding HxlR family transcriptional regulator